RTELELAGARVVDERARHISRHQVGGELHALGVESECTCECTYHQRLGDSRDALQQHMPPGEQADQKTRDGACLADDRLVDLGAHSVHRRPQLGLICFDHGVFLSTCTAESTAASSSVSWRAVSISSESVA